MAKESNSFGSAKYFGISVLIFAVFFFLLLPYYLGPDDLRGCPTKPDNTSLHDNCHSVDAIVALSGGDTKARTDEAIKLYKDGWAGKLIFSGAAQDKSGPSNAKAMMAQAIDAGVEPTNILTEELAVNTQENAANTKTLIQTNNLHRIILVTSAYHQKRASLEFQKRAGSDLVISNHPVAHDKQWHQNWYLTPIGWWLAVGELVKILGFYVNS
ncbi:MAG: YdcF family protein [Candidatus Saccharibacteria bacterium]|nr:YdcF family protein [Candidatus Saccharibacteria bacterium]